MPVSKKRKYDRKVTKRYRMVTFTNELFDDEFTLPDIVQMPGYVASALNRGQLEVFHKWLSEAGVEQEAVEAVATLDQEESQQFQKDWADGALVSVPKSAD